MKLPDCPFRADCLHCQREGFDWPLCIHPISHFDPYQQSKHAHYHKCEHMLEAGKCPGGWR